MRRQAEHRIRAAASLALTSGPLPAALVMNLPGIAGTAAIGWVAWNTWEPAAAAIAWILCAMAALWVGLSVTNSWRTLRRFASVAARSPRPFGEA